MVKELKTDNPEIRELVCLLRLREEDLLPDKSLRDHQR
jgi:hypothetical protein